MSSLVLGGIEGGATHSAIVLINGKGERLVQCKGPGTNHWALGVDECLRRVSAMVSEAKKAAGLPEDKPLTALGLALSGCEGEGQNRKIREIMLEKYPTAADEVYVTSDTVGSLAAVSEAGGMVIIAGTGSNALLINPDGTHYHSGGWGHALGDEGSGFWISHKAIKTCIDEQDNYKKPPYSTDMTWKTIKEHFDIKESLDLLPHCYRDFQKPLFAALCTKIYENAQMGDRLSQWLFAEAGRALAKFIIALLPKVHPNLLLMPEGIPVVCVGSVWNSWDYLKEGFLDEMHSARLTQRLSLLRSTTSLATGAVYLGAKAIDYDLPRDYSSNYRLLHKYIPKSLACNSPLKMKENGFDKNGIPQNNHAVKA
ncbi:hypothetical protein J437_LFUL003416 [Ladona fulva]|uniref:N-acetyl-D-glucosamine kinase n=1 Tax=Ladona fulva TaxID=123851 RepID=A0A8K0NWL9_LADFU|nr:hypothetical protein J437_LFUL003416 [Ladona fulva]